MEGGEHFQGHFWTMSKRKTFFLWLPLTLIFFFFLQFDAFCANAIISLEVEGYAICWMFQGEDDLTNYMINNAVCRTSQATTGLVCRPKIRRGVSGSMVLKRTISYGNTQMGKLFDEPILHNVLFTKDSYAIHIQ